MHLLEPLVSASDSLPAILLSVLMCQIFSSPVFTAHLSLPA